MLNAIPQGNISFSSIFFAVSPVPLTTVMISGLRLLSVLQRSINFPTQNDMSAVTTGPDGRLLDRRLFLHSDGLRYAYNDDISLPLDVRILNVSCFLFYICFLFCFLFFSLK